MDLFKVLHAQSLSIFRSAIRRAKLDVYIRDLPSSEGETEVPALDSVDWKAILGSGINREMIGHLRQSGLPLCEGLWDFHQLQNFHQYRIVFMMLHASPDRTSLQKQERDVSKCKWEWEFAFGEARCLHFNFKFAFRFVVLLPEPETSEQTEWAGVSLILTSN